MIPWYLNHDKYGSEPWAVQREALDRSEGKLRYAHFLEQGLGKTGLTLNEFVHYNKLGLVDFLLIICPNSFKLSWVNALEEWNIKHIPISFWPKSFPSKGNPSAYVMNWEAIRTEAGLKFISQLKRKVFLALDETSFIKNPTAQVSKKAILISRHAKMVRLLNGTPQTKNVCDYYPQLKCLNELEGFTFYAFRGRYAQMGGYMFKQVTGTQNEREFAEILNRCSFRATKADWRKDLPPRIISTVQVEMTPKQLNHYKEMKKDFITVIEGERITATLVLTQLGKLRQISSCLVMNEGEETLIEPIEKNPKLNAMLDLFYGQEGKVIIVYNYKLTGKMLEQTFEKEKIPYAVIKGQMKAFELEEQKAYFNDNPKCRVILCQQAASAMGHTLIAGEGKDRCATMIFVENSFSLRDRLQMLDRNHRGAQDQACTVYDLVASKTEAKIIKGLNANKAAADMIDDLVKSLTGEKELEYAM